MKRKSSRIEIPIEEVEKDMVILDRIIKTEETHYQWYKHSLCGLTLIAQILTNLIRGQIFPFKFNGYQKCQWYDNTLSVVFVLFCCLMTFVAIRRVNYEQSFKIKYGKGICKSDIKFSPAVVRKLVLVSFAGGWVAGALGLGGGSIFNPVLLSMGIPPGVASSTGMYLVMFT
jgi:hypothetical protein